MNEKIKIKETEFPVKMSVKDMMTRTNTERWYIA